MYKRYVKKRPKFYHHRSRSRTQRPRIDPQTIEKARGLQAKHGIPFSMAMRVARGKLSLSEVLDRMVRKRDIAKLVEKYRIPPSVAGQVLDGKISIEKYLQQHRPVQLTRPSRPSIIDMAKGAQREIGAMIDPDRLVVGKVVKCDRYQLDFAIRDGETIKALHKTSLHFAFRSQHLATVRRAMETDEKIHSLGLAPEKSMRMRRQYKNSILRKLADAKEKIAVTTRRGFRFRGVLRWFTKFEMGLQLDGCGPQVIFFRHAVERIATAAGEEIPGRVAGALPAGARA